MAKATTKKQTTSEIMLQYARALAAANDCIASQERIIAQQDEIIALGKTHFDELYELSTDNLKELTLSFAKGHMKDAVMLRELQDVKDRRDKALDTVRRKGVENNRENARQARQTLDTAISEALQNPDFCRMTRERQAKFIYDRTGRENKGTTTKRYSLRTIEKRIRHKEKEPESKA